MPKDSKVVLMEGSFGSELMEHVGPNVDGDPLWSARFIYTHREECLNAHRRLLKGGTQILTSGSYQASVQGYIKYLGVDREKAIDLIRDSVKLCKEAIALEEKESGTKLEVQVAGSMGPYGAYLHDGSEYTGVYPDGVDIHFLREWHRDKLEALIQEGADLIALETIPSSMEAMALLELLQKYPGVKAWLSFSCREDGESISSGERFEKVAAECWEISKGDLLAIGVNCLHPSLVVKFLQPLTFSHPYIPLIAYPNSGEVYNKVSKRWLENETNKSVSDYTEEWLDIGVKYIGGCCRTNAQDLIQFKSKIDLWMKL